MRRPCRTLPAWPWPAPTASTSTCPCNGLAVSPRSPAGAPGTAWNTWWMGSRTCASNGTESSPCSICGRRSLWRQSRTSEPARPLSGRRGIGNPCRWRSNSGQAGIVSPCSAIAQGRALCTGQHATPYAGFISHAASHIGSGTDAVQGDAWVNCRVKRRGA